MFWSEKNIFFLVSEVLSFRHKKQSSKNMSVITFNLLIITSKDLLAMINWIQSNTKKERNRQGNLRIDSMSCHKWNCMKFFRFNPRCYGVMYHKLSLEMSYINNFEEILEQIGWWLIFRACPPSFLYWICLNPGESTWLSV